MSTPRLSAIDCNKTYYDKHGAAVIVGFVKHYVVWRRPHCAVNVCTLNDFADKFSERPLSEDGGESTAQSSAVACPTPAEPKREYTMGDWWNDLDNPHRNR